VQESVALVSVPKAALKITVPLEGVAEADLRGNKNVRLALRLGFANAINVDVSQVTLAVVATPNRRRRLQGPVAHEPNVMLRRLASELTLEFEVATASSANSALPSMAAVADRVRVQTPSLIGFFKASAAALGVLGAVQGLALDSMAVRVAQATSMALPADYNR
jgi:hypothetical protein